MNEKILDYHKVQFSVTYYLYSSFNSLLINYITQTEKMTYHPIIVKV